MSVVDVLETEFNIKGNYDAQMQKNTASTRRFAAEFDKVNRMQMLGGLARSAAMAGIALGGVVAALGANAMRDSAQFDSLVKGLEAVEGSAEAARKKIEMLRKIAEAPGIGFEQAVTGYGALRRGGVSETLSASLVREAGNANAASGGSVATFEQIMRAFGQIAAKPKLQGDELLQLNEAGLPIQSMLKKAFGTSDTQELAKSGRTSIEILEGLARVMSEMPRVGGGFQNVLDNIGDTLQRASVTVGDALNVKLLPLLEGFGNEISRMVDDGTFTQLGESLADFAKHLSDSTGGVQGLVEKLQILADAAPDIADNLSTMFDGIQKLFITFGNMFTDANWWKAAFTGNFSKYLDEQMGKVNTNSHSMMEESALNYVGKDGKTVRERMEEAKAKDAANNAALAEERRLKGESETAKQTTSPAVQVLKKIEENTRALPDITRTIFGGGELGRMGITAHEIRAQRLSRKVAGGIQKQAQLIAMQTPRLTAR